MLIFTVSTVSPGISENVERTTWQAEARMLQIATSALLRVMRDQEDGATCRLRDSGGGCSVALFQVLQPLWSSPDRIRRISTSAIHTPTPQHSLQALITHWISQIPRETRFRASTYCGPPSQPGEGQAVAVARTTRTSDVRSARNAVPWACRPRDLVSLRLHLVPLWQGRRLVGPYVARWAR